MPIKQKTAKAMALRTVVTILYNHGDVDFEDLTNSESEQINKEIVKIKQSMYKRAVKNSGEFNPYLGY
jgi:hypothetical protein